MSPTVTTVIHHRMLRTASHLVDHPAIESVYFGDDDTVEATTAAARTIRLQPDPLEPDKARATRASMTVTGVPGEMSWPTFEVLIDASKGPRLVNRVLRRAVIIQNARTIPVGDTTLAGLLAPDRQHHHARDHFGHPGPMQQQSLRLAFPRPGADPRTGASVDVLLEADGTVSCHGPQDPYPEVTEAWLAVIDRHAGVERGTVLTALAQLAATAFTDADLIALGG